MTRLLKTATLILCLCAVMLTAVAAEGLTPLPLDTLGFGPAPKDENYLSENEYQDESIHVQIGEGRYVDTRYIYAHVKISDPSQLRTAPAGVYYSANATFSSTGTMRGRLIAKIVNAVCRHQRRLLYQTRNLLCCHAQTVQYRNSNSNAR